MQESKLEEESDDRWRNRKRIEEEYLRDFKWVVNPLVGKASEEEEEKRRNIYCIQLRPDEEKGGKCEVMYSISNASFHSATTLTLLAQVSSEN